MTDKITLQSVSNVDGSLITAINNNNATIQTAFDNTLSRNGQTPNQMQNALDMNGNQILNCAAAFAPNQPVTLGQLGTVTSIVPSLTGDVTGGFNGSAIPTTLATVNSNVGTFQGITVNGKGLVTAASNQSYLTGNQTITLSGPITGSGTTSIATTLAASAVGFSNINSAAIASSTQYLNDTSSLLLQTDQVWTSAAFVTVTFSATTTLDFSTFINMKETITSNVTFANPSNVKSGQCGILQIIQGTGGQTASWGGNFHFPGGTAPTLSTGAGAIDLLGYVALSSTYISIFMLAKGT